MTHVTNFRLIHVISKYEHMIICALAIVYCSLISFVKFNSAVINILISYQRHSIVCLFISARVYLMTKGSYYGTVVVVQF